jgi:hypothetical protein
MRYLVCCRSYLNSTLYFNLFLLSYEYIFFLHFSAASLTQPFSSLYDDAYSIISHAVRQMVMFSATWPLAVHKLAQEFMDPNPIKVVLFLSVFFFAFKQVPRLTVFSMSHCRLLLDQKTLLLTMT